MRGPQAQNGGAGYKKMHGETRKARSVDDAGLGPSMVTCPCGGREYLANPGTFSPLFGLFPKASGSFARHFCRRFGQAGPPAKRAVAEAGKKKTEFFRQSLDILRTPLYFLRRGRYSRGSSNDALPPTSCRMGASSISLFVLGYV
jgi:hypothetical protein